MRIASVCSAVNNEGPIIIDHYRLNCRLSNRQSSTLNADKGCINIYWYVMCSVLLTDSKL